MKNAHLLSAVIVGLMVPVRKPPTRSNKNECTMGLATKKHIPTDCSVTWKSENGKTYCFGNEEAKAQFLKDKEGNLDKAGGLFGRNWKRIDPEAARAVPEIRTPVCRPMRFRQPCTRRAEAVEGASLAGRAPQRWLGMASAVFSCMLPPRHRRRVL